MKTSKKLFVALLAVAMLFVLAACTADNTCTVTFYNGTEVYETVEVNKGDKLTLPKNPKGEKGKGLVGWSTIDGDMEEVINPETYVVEADVKLYAVWADVYTVVINADNGTPFDIKEVFAGTIIEQPADPVKEGFKFVEWRDALAEVPFDFSQPIYADVTIKAMYGDGSPNRVSDTKWDFTLGHGAWIGSQGGWNYNDPKTGLPVKDMVYTTTEDGYAAWGFTKTDSLDSIPVINGENGEGYGMKYIYNEGISVEASKAKLVVAYLKPKYFPIDMATSPNDQFRISVLTSKGGMIYGYGTGSEAWSLRTDAGSKNFIQVDQMEDGWIRVQFKIHELDVWAEDAIIKGIAISFVQRKATPVMDIISFKSIELLDQEEFIDPHEIDYVTKNEWDMTKEEDSTNWFGVLNKGVDTNNVKTTIDENGTQYVYTSTNKWRGMVMNPAKIDISKCSGIFAVTMDITGMSPTNYRLYIVTDAGGDSYDNAKEDASCYYADTSATDLADGWTVTPNADGTITVYYDLTKLEYWKTGTELQSLSFVIVDATTNGTVIYKSVSLVDTVNTHSCETDGHMWRDATCQTPKTCAACGTTEGEVADHSYAEGVCSVCGVPQVILNAWDLSDAAEAVDWSVYCSKKENYELTTAITSAGMEVLFKNANNWRAIVLKKTALDINKLTGKLTFTYSTEMGMKEYRIHLVTDLGGKLDDNGTSGKDYICVQIADILAGTVAGWTQTTNDDGSVTVTADLTKFSDFVDGTELKGLTICTVPTSKIANTTIIYKSVELEKIPEGYNCETEGHIWKDANCTEAKTCSVCGATEGEANGHSWKDPTCTAPKTCSVCGATEGDAKGHNAGEEATCTTSQTCTVCGTELVPAKGHSWTDATCQAPKTCTVCGATEGELGGHTDANADLKCDLCSANLCTDHNWNGATCQTLKTCSICGTTEGELADHSYVECVCSVCGVVKWDMTKEAGASQWYCAQAYTEVREHITWSELTADGFKTNYAHKNGWKGIILKNVEYDITKLSGLLSFTYFEEMDLTHYRVHVLTDKGGDLMANDKLLPNTNYYAAVVIADVANSTAWTRTENADGSITVTFDLTTLPFYKEGTVLKGMDIVTVTATGTTGSITYKSIEIQ